MGTATEPDPQGSVAATTKEVTLAKKLGLRELSEIDADLFNAGRFHLLGKTRGEQRPLPRHIDDLLDERLAQQAKVTEAG